MMKQTCIVLIIHLVPVPLQNPGSPHSQHSAPDSKLPPGNPDSQKSEAEEIHPGSPLSQGSPAKKTPPGSPNSEVSLGSFKTLASLKHSPGTPNSKDSLGSLKSLASLKHAPGSPMSLDLSYKSPSDSPHISLPDSNHSPTVLSQFGNMDISDHSDLDAFLPHLSSPDISLSSLEKELLPSTPQQSPPPSQPEKKDSPPSIRYDGRLRTLKVKPTYVQKKEAQPPRRGAVRSLKIAPGTSLRKKSAGRGSRNLKAPPLDSQTQDLLSNLNGMYKRN